MIYVDELTLYGGATGTWCHCWSDVSDQELDTFALKIGLKPQWAQLSRSLFFPRQRFYHYDLVPSKRILAVKAGATEVALHAYLEQLRMHSENQQPE